MSEDKNTTEDIEAAWVSEDGLPTGDALDGCATVRQWEVENGRGFWGNATTGYINDEDL